MELEIKSGVEGEVKLFIMKRLIVFILTIAVMVSTNDSFAQVGRKKGSPFRSSRFEPLYKWQGKYRRLGLQFSVGPTYTLTRIGPENTDTQLSADTTLRVSRDPKGHLGYYFDIGLMHIPKRKQKVLSYWDWALGIKHFGGQEQVKDSYVVNGTENTFAQRDGKWFKGYAFARLNLHNVIQVTNMDWIDNALGFNVDYAVYQDSKVDGAASLPMYAENNLKISLNYAFGWGFKMKDGFFIMPQIRVPILGAYEWDGARPSIRWFSSRYMPFMVTIKFGWLFKKNPNDCPPVFQHDSDREKNEQFQQGGGM